ncbi:MAG: hypothetical protein M3S32_07360, partial [Acidobacteriota bacterium]|nr:hypothetical protein [Acidobacteriota bacterium]
GGRVGAHSVLLSHAARMVDYDRKINREVLHELFDLRALFSGVHSYEEHVFARFGASKAVEFRHLLPTGLTPVREKIQDHHAPADLIGEVEPLPVHRGFFEVRSRPCEPRRLGGDLFGGLPDLFRIEVALEFEL